MGGGEPCFGALARSDGGARRPAHPRLPPRTTRLSVSPHHSTSTGIRNHRLLVEHDGNHRGPCGMHEGSWAGRSGFERSKTPLNVPLMALFACRFFSHRPEDDEPAPPCSRVSYALNSVRPPRSKNGRCESRAERASPTSFPCSTWTS